MSIYGRRRTRRALIDTIALRALSQAATVIGFIVLVRAMPKEDFGIFNLLYAFIPVVSTIASLGLEQTLRRYQPEYLNAGNLTAAHWLVSFVASARFGTNVVLLALMLLCWNYLAPIFKLTPYRGEFALFCFLILLHFQAQILRLSLAANMLQRFSIGSIAVFSILKLFAYAALAWLHLLTLTTAILADTLAGAVAYVFLRVAYRRYCPTPPGAPRYRLNSGERKRLFRYAVLNNFNDAGTLVLDSKSDNFFIAAFLDPISVGIYAFYTRLNEMIVSLRPMQVFDNIVQPLFFAVQPAAAAERIPKYFSFLLNTSLLLQWPILTYSLAYHVEIVAVVFGGKFAEYSPLLPLVVAFGSLNVIARPVTFVAQYDERAGAILLSKVFALYNIAALLVLIPIAGLYGAVIATGSAALFKNLFIWWHARRRARWSNFWAVVTAATAIWGAVLVGCMIVKSTGILSDLGNLAAGLAMCICGFLIYVRTRAISKSDRELLGAVIRGKEARLLKLVGIFR